ncbi:MAG: hypothetical protein KIS77_21325 [Saprospiraceae bacterium]|nr:hypothetical protein [Saprospiraceae bacterium]
MLPLAVFAQCPPLGPIEGPSETQACTNINPDTYTIPNSADANLVWTLTGNHPSIGKFIGPASGETVVVDWDAGGTAQLCATPTNPCYDNTPICLTISVALLPYMNPLPSDTVCPGDFISINLGDYGPPGMTFIWNSTNQFIGIPPSGTNDITFTVSDVYVPTSSVVVIQTYMGSCRGAGTTTGFTVLPTPSANAPAPVTACAGAPVSVALSGSPGATFAWENPNPAIGLPANGTGNISFTAANVAQQEIANITVTPLYTLGAVSCPGPPVTLTVTVNPAPTTDDPPDVSVCAGEPVAVTFSSPVPGAAFNWTNNNPAVGLPPAGTGNIAFTAANVAATQTATVTVTATALGCPGPPQTLAITVRPRPTAAQLPNIVACAGAPRRRQLLRLPAPPSTGRTTTPPSDCHQPEPETSPPAPPTSPRPRRPPSPMSQSRRLPRPAPNLPRHRQPLPVMQPPAMSPPAAASRSRRIRRAARNQLPVGQRQPLRRTATRRNRSSSYSPRPSRPSSRRPTSPSHPSPSAAPASRTPSPSPSPPHPPSTRRPTSPSAAAPPSPSPSPAPPAPPSTGRTTTPPSDCHQPEPETSPPSPPPSPPPSRPPSPSPPCPHRDAPASPTPSPSPSKNAAPPPPEPSTRQPSTPAEPPHSPSHSPETTPSSRATPSASSFTPTPKTPWAASSSTPTRSSSRSCQASCTPTPPTSWPSSPGPSSQTTASTPRPPASRWPRDPWPDGGTGRPSPSAAPPRRCAATAAPTCCSP